MYPSEGAKEEISSWGSMLGSADASEDCRKTDMAVAPYTSRLVSGEGSRLRFLARAARVLRIVVWKASRRKRLDMENSMTGDDDVRGR